MTSSSPVLGEAKPEREPDPGPTPQERRAHEEAHTYIIRKKHSSQKGPGVTRGHSSTEAAPKPPGKGEASSVGAVAAGETRSQARTTETFASLSPCPAEP